MVLDFCYEFLRISLNFLEFFNVGNKQSESDIMGISKPNAM